MSDQPVVAQLVMDRGKALGNTAGDDNRGKLHVLQFSSILSVDWKWFSVAYPTTTKEVYTFWDSQLLTTQLAIVELNYTDATKSFLASGGKP